MGRRTRTARRRVGADRTDPPLHVLQTVRREGDAARDHGWRPRGAHREEAPAALARADRVAGPHHGIGGWPFITHVISGDLPSAKVTVSEATGAAVRVERVSITLHDLTFSAKRLVTRGGGEIRAKSGQGTAVMTSADVNDALANAGL